MTSERLLLADDEPLSRDFMAEALGSLGLEVTAVVDGLKAIEALDQPFDYVFTDLQMPGADGMQVLAESKMRDLDRPVIMVTAHGTMSVAVQALRSGADDILEKPVSLEDLELALVRARERRRLLRENRYFRAQSVGGDLKVFSRAMSGVVDLVARVAPSKATVLITGESGTGKERVAALVHRRSDRADRPYVKINCAAIPESLMESEFFGHEAGAFTGASKRREGRFELADGGTLFLDEVAEMSPVLQAKLLRILQEGEFTRVGGTRTIRSDVRIVVATNRNLEKEVAEGRFREDLYYRLNVVPIHLPPLRERTEEIVPLAEHFLNKGVTLAPDAQDMLRAHRWEGNVRELQNVVQRACLLCENKVITGVLLAGWLRPKVEDDGAGTGDSADILPTQIRIDPIEALVGKTEREVLDALMHATLESCNDNRTKAAEVLGIGVRTLFNRQRNSPRNSTSRPDLS